MGAYLSEPITEKVSTDESNDKLSCGASSMQGWRESQEDAHNCILEFDTNTSYFAVYDGHGGREVAQYCSQELPEFLKSLEQYKSGNYKEALEEAFLKFDATIATPDVKAILKKIALNNDGEEDVSDEEENVNNLYEEATMPIEQVIEKYTSSKLKNLKDGEKLPLSPFLKPRKTSSMPGTSNAGASNSEAASDSPGDVVSSTSGVKSEEISSTDSIDNTGGENTNSDNVVTSEESNNKPDSSGDTKSTTDNDATNENSNQNGDAKVSSSSPQENGKIVDKRKGKGKALMKTRGMENSILLPRARQRARRTVAQLYSSLLQADSEEDDSEDEEDKTFEGPNESSDDDDESGKDVLRDAEDSDKTSDEEEEDEDEDDDDDEYDTGDNVLFRGMGEGPGFDSGCTAVVALLKENELYVANAGDSRCIVCRNGQAIEMSIDHKPEDPPELKRITNAGGDVTSDGRVNGGLNLSRAIGDHEYKQNKELSDREQMITALPDIKTLTINPAEDEFMVLACDGIWNFMSSQEVVDFIRPRLQENPDKISQICEEMFDHCLAPDTMGDGTGCDNMTAIIVTFKPNIMKRSATTEPDVQNQCKRAKTEDPKPEVETAV